MSVNIDVSQTDMLRNVTNVLTRFFRVPSKSSFRSVAYTFTMWSAAPFVSTGAGLLFAYCMYFFTNVMLNTSCFFCLPRRVLLLGPPIPTCKSGSYFSKGLGSPSSASSPATLGPSTESCCVRLSMTGVPSSTPGGRYRCMRSTWSAIARSRVSSTSSVTTNSKSKRDKSESGNAMFLCGSLCTSYYTSRGTENQPQRYRTRDGREVLTWP